MHIAMSNAAKSLDKVVWLQDLVSAVVKQCMIPT